MSSSARIIRAALLAAAAVALAAAAYLLREKHQEAGAAVENIQDSLKPWTQPRGPPSSPG